MKANSTALSKDGVQYDYKLSLVSNILNPPEVFVFRCTGMISLGVCIWLLFRYPLNPVGWLVSICTVVFYWIFIFRHGLPLYSKGNLVSLAITEKSVAFEINGKLFYALRNEVTVRRGLFGVHIISRPQGDYLLVSKDAISFDQLKAEITAPSLIHSIQAP